KASADTLRKNRRFMPRANHTRKHFGKPNQLVSWSRRRQASEVSDPAVGESGCPDRVYELWWDICPIIGPIGVRSDARRCFVTQINPCFGGATPDAHWNFLIGCSPGQPNSIHGHPLTNLSLADQCLICRREALIHFRTL